MPAKKIIEAVTSTLAVIGSSMAKATAGPLPGSTATAVQSAQPTSAHSRLAGEIAVANPCINALRMSMSDPAAARQARKVDCQELGEGPEHGRRNCEACRGVDGESARAPRALALGASKALDGEQVAQRTAEDEADGGDERCIA